MNMHPRMALTIGGVLLVAATLVGCGGGSSNNSNPMAPAPTTGGGGTGVAPDVTITINGMDGAQSFSPNPGSVKVGQTVAWRNTDSVAHTATADGGSFNTGTIAPGATSSPIMMSAAGSLAYHCSFHPSMVGSLTVTQ
jgi:plastocyanin